MFTAQRLIELADELDRVRTSSERKIDVRMYMLLAESANALRETAITQEQVTKLRDVFKSILGE